MGKTVSQAGPAVEYQATPDGSRVLHHWPVITRSLDTYPRILSSGSNAGGLEVSCPICGFSMWTSVQSHSVSLYSSGVLTHCAFSWQYIINPRRACAARVTVVVLCVCVCVCVSRPLICDSRN